MYPHPLCNITLEIENNIAVKPGGLSSSQVVSFSGILKAKIQERNFIKFSFQ
jgi:hypothetical protein